MRGVGVERGGRRHGVGGHDTDAAFGDLSVVAVVTALYPAGTVLLARGVLAERIHRGQLVGLGTAAVAVSLLALT